MDYYKKFLHNFVGLDNLPEDLIMKELKSKLQETYVNINGNLFLIQAIEETYVKLWSTFQGSFTMKVEEIMSMEPWVPSTGTYILNGVVLKLTKHPERQWRKSFSWNFYSHKVIEGDSEKLPAGKEKLAVALFNLDQDDKTTVISSKNLYFLSKKIGVVDGKKIKPVDEEFKQEVIDFVQENKAWAL